MGNFKCNVKECEYHKKWHEMCPNNMLWLDINAHFVRHHPELHKEMSKYIFQKVDGKWIEHSPTKVAELKREIDGGTIKKAKD